MLLTEGLRDEIDVRIEVSSLGLVLRTRIQLHFSDPAELNKLDRVRPVEELDDTLGWLTVQFKANGGWYTRASTAWAS